MLKKKRPDRSRPDRHARTLRPLTWAGVLTWLAVSVAAFVPDAHLWGLDHLAYYPVPARIIVLLILGASFLPSLRYRLAMAAEELVRWLRRGRAGTPMRLVIVTLICMAGFYVFRSATLLWGDGQAVANTFEAGFEENREGLTQSAAEILRRERLSPGAMLLYYGAARVGQDLLDFGSADAIRLTSILVGGFYVFVCLMVLRRSSWPADVTPWFLVLTIFSTPVLLYCGYVEFYTPMMFLAALVTVTALQTARGRRPWWVPVALLVSAVFMHVQAILLAPAVLYAVIRSHRPRVARAAFHTLMLSSVLIAAAGRLWAPLSSHYLPLWGSPEADGVLTPGHLWDLLNQVWLLLPALPVILVMALAIWRRPMASDTDLDRAPRVEDWHIGFLLSVPLFLYLLMFRPEIGVARDWDLFSMTGIALTVLSVLVITRYSITIQSPREVLARSIPVLLTCTVMTAAWIGTHASWQRSADRFQRSLEYDSTHASYGYENLAMLYASHGQIVKAVEHMRTAVEISHSARQMVRLSKYYDQAGRRDFAIKVMRPVVEQQPGYSGARRWLILLLERDRQYGEILQLAQEGAKLFPQDDFYPFYIGEASIALGNVEAGVEAFRRARDMSPPATALEHIDQQLRRHQAARSR